MQPVKRQSLGAHLLTWLTARTGGDLGAVKAKKVDFFALLYIVKKERIVYIEILF